MEPTRNSHGALVDLLDRVLDRGIVIHAELIISVAGVPLIGVNLRAALAGMETMLEYGMMREWDQRIRSRELKGREDWGGPPQLGQPEAEEVTEDVASARLLGCEK